MTILVTGAAGFIGAALAARLLEQGHEVVGVDNLSDYYDVQLKRDRLRRLQERSGFRFVLQDLAQRDAAAGLFADLKPRRVAHLAAQAGVRYSLQNPHAYVDANISGFLNVLEGCRRHGIEHLVYASSSSVYGANGRLPFSEHDNVDHPVSLYGATKKANELMAHAYSHLFAIPATGLRFFTVYGPWGRPDMSLFIFTRRILAGEAIPIYNEGHHQRDFTYIDDIIEGVVRVLDRPPLPDSGWNALQPDPASGAAPYRLYNIGNQRPVPLLRYVQVLEEKLGRKARLEMLPLQPGDVPATFADVAALAGDFGYAPATPIEIGVGRFVDWYRDYYRVP
jgi:UDP-glucuronate 4-epimerase